MLPIARKSLPWSGPWRLARQRGAPCMATSTMVSESEAHLSGLSTRSYQSITAALQSHAIQYPAHPSGVHNPDGLAPARRCSRGLDAGPPRLCSIKTRARPGCLSLWNAHCADSLGMTLVSRQIDSSQSKPESSPLMAGRPPRHSTSFGERCWLWRSDSWEPDSCCPRHVML